MSYCAGNYRLQREHGECPLFLFPSALALTISVAFLSNAAISKTMIAGDYQFFKDERLSFVIIFWGMHGLFVYISSRVW